MHIKTINELVVKKKLPELFNGNISTNKIIIKGKSKKFFLDLSKKVIFKLSIKTLKKKNEKANKPKIPKSVIISR